MSDEAPLSIESAISLMNAAPVADAAPANTEGAPSGEDTQPAAAGQDTQPADAAAQDAPSDEGKTNDEQADQGNALPTIEPPSSWKTEEKEVFNSLPRAAQEAIARREQDRTTELRNLQNGQAEQRKAAEAEVARLKGLADKIGAHIHNEVTVLAREFPEIKSEADVVALSQSDPARFSLFQAKLMQFNSARQAEAEAQTALTQKAETARTESLNQAKDALLNAFPAWKDPAVARKELTELQDYAIKQGASEQAARTAFDPVVYKLAQKAMLYDRAQAAKAKAVVRDAPRTLTPGPSNSGSKADVKAQGRQEKLSKLDKTGALEDALGLLRA